MSAYGQRRSRSPPATRPSLRSPRSRAPSTPRYARARSDGSRSYTLESDIEVRVSPELGFGDISWLCADRVRRRAVGASSVRRRWPFETGSATWPSRGGQANDELSGEPAWRRWDRCPERCQWTGHRDAGTVDEIADAEASLSMRTARPATTSPTLIRPTPQAREPQTGRDVREARRRDYMKRALDPERCAVDNCRDRRSGRGLVSDERRARPAASDGVHPRIAQASTRSTDDANYTAATRSPDRMGRAHRPCWRKRNGRARGLKARSCTTGSPIISCRSKATASGKSGGAVSSLTTRDQLGGRLPVNTSGAGMSEAYVQC